jgi:hypothetical protein
MANLAQNRGNLCLIYDLNYPGGIAQLQIASCGAREFMDRHGPLCRDAFGGAGRNVHRTHAHHY